MHESVSAGIRNDAALRDLVFDLVTGLAGTLHSVASFRELSTRPSVRAFAMDGESWLWLLEGSQAVLRGTMPSAAGAGSPRDGVGLAAAGERGEVLIALDTETAVTLADALTSTPAVLPKRPTRPGDRGRRVAWHEGALRQLGTVLFRSFNHTLRTRLGFDPRLRCQGIGPLRTGYDQREVVARSARVIYEFNVQVDDRPQAAGSLLLDPETARCWNGGAEPLPAVPSLGAVAPSVGPSPPVSCAVPRPKDGALRPVSAYVGEESAELIRACCRRIEVPVSCQPLTEIPNPAAHRGEVVVLEVPEGDERRFEWAKRMKDSDADISVVLLIHQASRERVIQGFLTKADAVSGWPSMVAQLGTKLEKLACADAVERRSRMRRRTP